MLKKTFKSNLKLFRTNTVHLHAFGVHVGPTWLPGHLKLEDVLLPLVDRPGSTEPSSLQPVTTHLLLILLKLLGMKHYCSHR